jgi:hypothetical protein
VPFFVSYLDDQPLGACTIYNSLSAKLSIPASTASADAGSSFTVTGPKGSEVLPGSPGQFTESLSAAGTYLSPGAYTLAGTGGADIGAFSAAFNIPAAPVLTSPANLFLPPVTRSSGLTVTWTGGASNAYVQVQVQNATDNTNTNGATVVCTAAASAGALTIPPYALLALPAGNVTSFQFRQRTEGVFTASGLNLGSIMTANAATVIANFTLN